MKIEPREYTITVESEGGRITGATIHELPHDLWGLGEERDLNSDTWVSLGSFGGKFYGGCGEGRQYDTFGQALLGTLYDELQVHCPGIPDGTTFKCEYDGAIYLYAVQGVHVVPVARIPAEPEIRTEFYELGPSRTMGDRYE